MKFFLFAFTLFYAFLLFHFQVNGAPHHAMCHHCKQSINVEDKTEKEAMLKHLSGCVKFFPSEEQAMQETMKKFAELTKNVDKEFKENIEKHFPELAIQMAELCTKYCDFDLDKKDSTEIEEKKNDTKTNEKLEKFEKQIEKMIELNTNLIEIITKMEERENKKEEGKPNEDGEKSKKRKKIDEEKSNEDREISSKKSKVNQQEIIEKLPELDKRLAELHKESMPICKDAAGRICKVREKFIYLEKVVVNVPAFEFIVINLFK